MTKEEAIKILESYKQISMSFNLEEDINALDMAIQSLEQTDGDLISRNAVLDVIEREEFKGDAISEIEKLQPIISHSSAEKKTNGDLISRQAAIDEIEYELEMINSALDSLTLDYNARERIRQRRGEAREILNSIQQLPSVTPQPSAEQSDRIITELEKITERINEIKGDNKYVVSDYMYGLYQAFGIVDDIIADRIAELKGEQE